MWAGFRHSVYELGVTNVGGVSPGCYVLGFASVGKVLPVLVSEAYKSWRGQGERFRQGEISPSCL